MTWTCDLTTDGWTITWSRPCGLPAGGVAAFYTGLEKSDLEAAFTNASSSGSEEIELPGGDADIANASGRMDVEIDGETYETGLVLPLVPGLSFRDVRLLRQQAENHRRSARLLSGYEGSLYRRYQTGAVCPYCTDPATGTVLKHSCAYCDGSGREAGWAGPYSTHAIFMQMRGSNLDGSGAGTVHEAVSATVRLTAFPRPRINDRLLLPGGQVYIVGQQQRTVSGVAGIPAVVECVLRRPDPDAPEAAIPESWL